MLNVDDMKIITTDESVKEAIDNNYDVCEAIAEEMFNDCDREPDGALQLYADADKHERAVMDALLMKLCGWTMGTIIRFAKERSYVVEE